jgi:menaquinone-dependent protoporphyrinogen oxidase
MTVLVASARREDRIFAGRLAKRELGLGERALTGCALRVPEGDFREWSEISTWATTIAGALNAQPVA